MGYSAYALPKTGYMQCGSTSMPQIAGTISSMEPSITMGEEPKRLDDFVHAIPFGKAGK
jgi:hypothetical protein